MARRSTRPTVQQFVALFLAGADRDQLDPILDACAAVYIGTLDEDQQVGLQGQGQGFAEPTTPGFGDAGHERRVGEAVDLAEPAGVQAAGAEGRGPGQGHPRAIDMDSYRVEKKALMKIALADTDAEIAPVPPKVVGASPSPSWTG